MGKRYWAIGNEHSTEGKGRVGRMRLRELWRGSAEEFKQEDQERGRQVGKKYWARGNEHSIEGKGRVGRMRLRELWRGGAEKFKQEDQERGRT